MTKSEPKDPQSLPFLVLGNKCDLDEGLKKVSAKEAREFCEENNFLFYETSAKDNQNIEEAFRAMVVRVIARQDNLNSKILSDASANNSNKDQGSAVAGNANRRMTRRTNTKLVLEPGKDGALQK